MTIVQAFLVGCAAGSHVSSYVPGKRIAPAAVSGIRHAEGRCTGHGGVQLFCQSWRPETESTAVVVVVHGLKDYSDRYADFASALVQRGYAVHAFDLRGHGDSAGERVWIESFDDYLADLDLFIRRVRAEEPGKKLFLFGHSMGGAIVTLHALTAKTKPDGLITSAAALKDDASPLLTGPVKFLSWVAPRAAVFELNNADFSRDPKVVASMTSDPLVYNTKAPARTAAEILGAIARIRSGAKDLTIPLWAMHGGLDKVTPPAGSQELVAAAGSTDKTMKLYEGLVHDLLHEPERQQVINDVGAWIDQHSR